MNDLEIIKLIKGIKPESEKQRKALESMERAFYRSINSIVDESVEDFLSAYDRSDLINKPSAELYDEYLEFCEESELDDVSHTLLSKITMQKFNLRCAVVKLDNKSVRVYR